MRTCIREKSVTSIVSRFLRILSLWLLVFSQLLAQRTQYVVLIVVDGTRYTETFGDSTHANIPIIWNQLCPLGAIYTSFWNDGATMTNSGHASILSGTREALKNNGTELSHHPTVFEYLRKETGAPADQCWVALGKTKLQMLASSDHKEYGSRYGASVRKSSSEYDNLIAMENTTSVLANHHPKLTILNVPAADEFAHNGFRDKYLGSIRQADTVVASIWEAIQTDSLLRNKTTMIVTNDHGRHTTDYTDHGDQCEGCRHIMLLVIGPDTPAGVIDSSMHRQVDIAPTVGALLGFRTPYAVGEVIESAVTTSVQNSRR
jgi:hypothetical protein